MVELADDVVRDVPAAQLTTLAVGGPLRWLWPVRHAQDARNALAFARQNAAPVWILGGGSNVVVADEGLAGVVLQPQLVAGRGIEVLEVTPQAARLRIAAGAQWDDVVAFAVEHDWQGVECLAGIPGQAGAAPIQNIGAYGQEVADVVAAVSVLDLNSEKLSTLSPTECQFSYRDSLFKRNPLRWLVLGLDIQLRPCAQPCTAYSQVEQALAAVGSPSLRDVRQTVLNLRRAKSMVIDPADANSRSCGSFFVNPVVDSAQATEVIAVLAQFGETAPQWPRADGAIKLSAAWLIERCGLAKGYGTGRVGLSMNHTLAIVNRGEATATEVIAFADHVSAVVYRGSGVQLGREPVHLT